MGYFEASNGLGSMLGPLIGSALYAIGGYPLPFYGLGVIFIIVLPLLINAGREIDNIEARASEKVASTGSNNNEFQAAAANEDESGSEEDQHLLNDAVNRGKSASVTASC